MVQDDGQIRHGLGKGCQLGQLREADPGIEGEAHPRQHPGPGAVFGAGQHPLLLAVVDLRMRVPGNRVADAAKSVGAGGLKRLQHRLDPVAQLQIGMADDCRRRPTRAVEPAGAGSSEALDELDLADGAHLRRSIRPVHRSRLDKHGGAHIVAAIHVGGQLVQQIALVGDALGPEIPEVVMRVADRDVGLQGRLLGQGQPVVSSIRHDGFSVAVSSHRSTSRRRPPTISRRAGSCLRRRDRDP